MALTKETERLTTMSAIDVEAKIIAWEAVDSALRRTFKDGGAGASRAPASLALLTAMRSAGKLRLAELRASGVELASQ